MGNITVSTYAFLLIFLLETHKIYAENGSAEKPTDASQAEPKPLATITADKNVIENVNNSNRLADEVLSRVRRQFGFDPYYYGYRRRYPLPIFLGGGFGGYGGRGYGGGGFGGRGFGGRGFGGRGIGGRGGGIGGFGGGHGGRG